MSENSILMGIEQTTVSSNEPIVLYLSFPSSFKKEYKTAQNLIFPDIPDLIKGPTLYSDDEILKIEQWYWPRKPGVYTFPPLRFNIRDYEVSMPSKNLTVKSSPSAFTYVLPETTKNWEEHVPDLRLELTLPSQPIYEREMFELELSLLVPFNNQEEWTFIGVQEQLLELNKRIGGSGLLVQSELGKSIPMDTIERDKVSYYKYTIYKGQCLAIDTSEIVLPSLTFRYVCYQTQEEEKGLFGKKTQILRKALVKELHTPIQRLHFLRLPPHPLRNEIAVGNFHVKPHPLAIKQKTKGFNFNFDIEGSRYLLPLHEPWIDNTIPGFYITMNKRTVGYSGSQQRTRFNYFMHSDMPKSINVKNNIFWVYFDPQRHRYDTLTIDQPITMTNETSDKESLSGEDGFLQLLYKASNTEYSLEKDESLNRFANLIIFLLFLILSVLIFKR